MSGDSFANAVVTALGTLIKQQIKSPNYVPGVSGWSINKSGSAEFNNLTIRGTFYGTNFIINSNGIFFYSGTPANGNLILSLAGVAGTDTFGNVYPQGLKFTAGGQSLVLGILGGSPLIYAITGLPETTGSAIQIIKVGSGTAAFELMQLLGAEDSTQLDLMLSSLSGSSADGTLKPNYTVQYKNSLGAFYKIFEILSTGIINAYGLASGNQVLQIRVVADANPRFTIQADGTLAWGPGTAVTDTSIHRTAIGELTVVNNLVAAAKFTAIAGTPATPSVVTTDTWHQATLTGTWTGSGNGVNGLWYRLTPDNNVHIVADLTVPAAPGTIFTLPTHYVPNTTQNIPAGSYVAGVSPHIMITNTGTITASALGAAGTALVINALLPLATL
jgi:hypothetical protein